MKVLVVYATLSGSTMTAANIIADTLKAHGHEVTMATADQVTAANMTGVGAVLFGSPSWEDEGLDGQPLPEVRKCIEGLKPEDLTGKKVALFGLGDVSYPRFCGAVDVMAEKLKALNVTPMVESLRIDRYYSSPENEQKVKSWAERLGQAFMS